MRRTTIPMTLVLPACLISGCGGGAPAAQMVEAATVPLVQTRRVALTFDDLPALSTSRDLERHQEITEGILAALAGEDAAAIGFVNEDKLRDNGEVTPARVELLRAWLEAGHQLGNHTYSHPDLHRVPLADFQREVLRGEEVTRALLRERGEVPRWFRHPFLHTGRSVETRQAFETFLGTHGYRVAPVTIDNYDYVFARAYDRALDASDSIAAARVAETYISYMDSVFGYYEAQARSLFDAEPPHVLLLHANRINAHHLDDLLIMMRRRGYDFITLDEALEDSIYHRRDTYVGPAGVTWLHRWALSEGMRGEVFAGEPPVPGWIEAQAGGS